MPLDILITGANRGLGLAMTERFLSLEHRVFVISRHESDALKDLKKGRENQLQYYPGDVADETSVQKAIAAVSKQTANLDILINNAAVHLDPQRLPLEEVDFSVYLPTFQVNTVGPLVVTRHALPLLRKGGKKLICHISSEAGSINDAWRKSEYAYCTSKSALNMASRIMQNALKDEGIKVLALHPGWFRSDMGTQEAPISTEEAARNVVNVILGPVDLSGPGFVDFEGKEMKW
jgi:NAD(P)-dependent dehydrogenase (short-subunit alcohol dehydrogenase family)